jgi:hypothetical protein
LPLPIFLLAIITLLYLSCAPASLLVTADEVIE